MEPAPIPRGTAQRQSQRKLCEQEKPANAAAVRAVERAVTFAVPSFAMTFVLKRLENRMFFSIFIVGQVGISIKNVII